MNTKIESIKLKPCPSCGRDLASIRYHSFGCHHIECNNCHMQTAEFGGCQSAHVWNEQPESHRLQQENAELREALVLISLNSSFQTNMPHETDLIESLLSKND